ncbi:uncharacterized protein LOC143883611 [Tasmannia lanceolata]|uniref:uncharacterized protein LOC143883611 n=1 Tax=Tasmannia lanceolata TaxID=3420 RepID=UPI004062C4B1
MASAGSSSSGKHSQGSAFTPCHCGQRAPLRTSWTSTNFGRRFLGCSGYEMNASCGFFEWVDPPICVRGSAIVPKVMQKFSKVLAELQRLDAEVDKYRRRKKILRTLLAMSWGAALLCAVFLVSVLK